MSAADLGAKARRHVMTPQCWCHKRVEAELAAALALLVKVDAFLVGGGLPTSLEAREIRQLIRLAQHAAEG